MATALQQWHDEFGGTSVPGIRRDRFINAHEAESVCMNTWGSTDAFAQERYRLAMAACQRATELGLMAMPNVPALRKSLEWVEWQNEEKQKGNLQDVTWNQGTWRAVYCPVSASASWDELRQEYVLQEPKDCKTAMCFAGHAADTAGAVWHERGEGDDSVVILTPQLAAQYDFVEKAVQSGFWERANGKSEMPIADFARQHLGLEDTEAGWLFSGDNSYPDIKRIVSVICERASETV